MENATHYRETPARCPTCAITMQQRDLFDAIVDVCGECRGVWVDWFDGELERVVEQLEPSSTRAKQRSKETGNQLCPRCQAALVHEDRGGGSVFRCGDCGGAFVPRASFDAIVAFAREAPPSSPDRVLSLPARLLAVLQSLLSGKN